MKKLALVLGSLLVVGTVASAKEVVPAPVVVPEKVVEVVEKPVIVYRDREVAPAWRPNGSVDVHLRNWTKVENHDTNDVNWKGADEWTQLRTTSTINFTPNQKLVIHTRNNYGLDDENYTTAEHQRLQLEHGYNFGKLGASKVNARLRTVFRHGDAGDVINAELAALTGYSPYAFNKYVETGVVFDFSEYFFKNDYVKATALELAPFYRYQWNQGSEYANNVGLYANAEFELPWGVTFQAEFDDLFTYSRLKVQGDKYKVKTGTVELTLAKDFTLYKEGKHTLKFGTDFVYATDWAYNKKSAGTIHTDLAVGQAGTLRKSSDKVEKMGRYSAKFDPYLAYTFQATDFVKVYARLGAEYKNRVTYRPGAKYWRWQPYARLGVTVTF